MLVSFFESIKYLGHMWPIAILRIYVGVFFLTEGLDKIHAGFLNNSVLQETVHKWILTGAQYPTYVRFLNDVVLPHPQVFAYLVTFGELVVGASYILGFMVRPAALLAIFLSINFMLAAGTESLLLNKILIAVNICMYIVSAGRCVGFDYYFYKRVRGLWW